MKLKTKKTMLKVLAGAVVVQMGLSAYGISVHAQPVQVSPNGVQTLSPSGAIQSTGTWDLGTRAGEYVYVAGMRGIDPATNRLMDGEEARIRQAFVNMRTIAESEGASLRDATRIVVYTTDMYRYRPIVNKIQEELWGAGPYPPRTIVEVDRLNQDDIVEVEGTFYAPTLSPAEAAEKGTTSSNEPGVSPNGVKTLTPAGAIRPTGTWNLATRAGDGIYVAGMRGIDPATDRLVDGEEARIRQAFVNMRTIAESEGASLRDATRIVVYTTDMYRYRPIVNKIQEELWGAGPYPPRTIIEVDRLNQDDIVEVEGTFYAPENKALSAVNAANLLVSPNGVKTLTPAGAIRPTGTWNLATRAGDGIYVAGMRGIDPATDRLVDGEEARIRQAFVNMRTIAESEGASLRDATRIIVYTTDMYRYRPIVNKIQEELWGAGPYPPRTIVEVDRLNQDDIVEVEGTFYAPKTVRGYVVQSR